jgi:hypothetical protein
MLAVGHVRGVGHKDDVAVEVVRPRCEDTRGAHEARGHTSWSRGACIARRAATARAQVHTLVNGGDVDKDGERALKSSASAMGVTRMDARIHTHAIHTHAYTHTPHTHTHTRYTHTSVVVARRALRRLPRKRAMLLTMTG